MPDILDSHTPKNPLFSDDKPATTAGNQAADLIRQKINTLYIKEPDAKVELAEVEAIRGHRSRHQQFMHELNTSGRSLAEIQTAWHNYYTELPDKEKHQVWQEFYANHAKASQPASHQQQPPAVPQTHHKRPAANAGKIDATLQRIGVDMSVAEIRQQLLGRVNKQARKRPRSAHHQSLAFGLTMGTVAAAIFMFGFFNERFLAPFITPSKTVSSTPIIVDASNPVVGPEPKIIIPKINVEIPVVYTEPSIEEKAVQRALEDGVLHYATTPNPGELGNGVIFGHSSNNIFNTGKYKFAFVMLKHLETGDTFMLHKDGKRYVYRVFDKKVVPPTEVGVLGHAGRPATFTLITCDPPGTSLNRLVVYGEQISPDPAANVASSAQPLSEKPAAIPSDAPSLWSRIFGWLSS